MSRFEREIRPVITDEAAALSGTLHESMAGALAVARTSTRAFTHEQFPHALPMILRCALRLHLEDVEIPRGWELSGNSRLMGQLLLSHPDLAVDLRFLKERRKRYPGGVPTAGRNPTRRQAWSGDLPLPLDFETATPARTTILWVWDFEGDPDDERGGFTQRLVHTIGPGTYGRAVPCDLSLDLLPGGKIFDRLKFAGGEDDTDFFQVEIAETVEDGD